MSIRVKWVAIAVVGLAVAIQVYRPARTNPPMDVKQDLTAAMTIDGSVREIINRACTDCHTDGTVWPWYSEVAPVSWLLVSDVNGGREHMNFSEWGTYPVYKRADLLDKICKEVTQRDMPPSTYTLLHAAARLSESEREAICGWTKTAATSRPVARLRVQ